MNNKETDTLAVQGASIYFEVRGTGPVLLISQSGEGTAGRSADLVDQLVPDYTVVTYDRRGLSRSPLDDPASGVTIDAHADDVQQVLAHLTDDPAIMLGCSLGATIGMNLITRYPGQVSTLIAHEPVAPRLLSSQSERIHHEQELRDVQNIFHLDGLSAVIKEIAKILGIDPSGQDTEPGITQHPFDAERKANFIFFIENDFDAILGDTLDAADLKNTLTRIVPAVGRATPRTVFDYRCAQELAMLIGVDVAEFPGGHNGNTTHPKAYAARLRDILSAERR